MIRILIEVAAGIVCLWLGLAIGWFLCSLMVASANSDRCANCPLARPTGAIEP